MLYFLENNYMLVTINSKGAELTSLKEISNNYEYIWQGDKKYWEEHSPCLFPIVGNLNEKSYSFKGKTYTLNTHGFAKEKEFLAVKKDRTQLCCLLRYDDSTLGVYPFKFELAVKYILESNKLFVKYEVRNLDNEIMWFSIGAHPGFNCEVSTATGRKSGVISLDSKETANRIINESGYLTGKETPFFQGTKDIDLGTIDFDHSQKVLIFKGLKSHRATLTGAKSISVGIEGFPFLGIWSPLNSAPFVCIEPWYGVTDKIGVIGELNNKDGIQKLEPGSTFKCSYDIECHI